MNTQTGTLEIAGIAFETPSALETKARKLGQTSEEYVRSLIEQNAFPAEPTAIRRPIDDEPRKAAGGSAVAAGDWIEQMKALAEKIDAAWQSEKSGLEELAEMRR